MRVHIIGTNPTAIALRGLLSKSGRYALTPKPTPTAIVVTIREAGSEVVIDGVDSPLEARMVSRIAELLKDGRVSLQRGGGNQNDHAVVITLPPNNPDISDAVERGVFRALDQIQRVVLPKTVIGRPFVSRLAAMFSWILPLIFVIVMPASGFAQNIVSQGASNSGISPWYVRFIAAQHFICDSGCGSPPATADKTVFVFGTTNVSPGGFVVDDVATDTVAENSYGAARMTTNREQLAYISNIPHFICDSGCGTAAAVAMADVTANPTIPQTAAFGMAYNGATWDRVRGTIANGLLVNVSNASIAVTGTFFQGTQPVSGTFWPTAAGAPSSARLSDGSAFYDARSIRALTFAGDKVDVGGSAITVTSGTITTITNVVHVDDNSGSLTVDGSVTANAGTNLNTSALALDATVLTGNASLVTIATQTRVRGTASGPVMVPATDSDTQLLASNTARVGWQVCNQSQSPLLVKFGSGATAFSYNVRVASGSCFADTTYTGQVNGAWFIGADRYALVSESQ